MTATTQPLEPVGDLVAAVKALGTIEREGGDPAAPQDWRAIAPVGSTRLARAARQL
ncbi:MAG: hypothetical protein R3F11_07135 [Verrucomicrobiales bacterium]